MPKVLQEKYLVFEMSTAVPPVDWIRLTLVYCHLIASAFAIVFVLSADWQIVKGTFTIDALRQTASRTSVVLVVLWITGLALVYCDTGLNLGEITARPKMVLKLIIVGVLTINGFILHMVSFPLLERAWRLMWSESLVLAITGALSTSHWVLAAFVGVARPFGQWPLETLLIGYMFYVSAVLFVAVMSVPVLRRHLPKRRRVSRPVHEPSTIGTVDIFLPLSNQP